MIRTAMLGWVVSAVLLAGCTSGPQIRVLADPDADLAQYRNFAYYDPLGTDEAQYSSMISQYLKIATSRELLARGFVYREETPDLLVNFSASLEERMRVTQTPTPAMIGLRGSWTAGYYGYRRGLYDEFPLYQTDVRPYREGTLNIAIVDAANKRLLWEGIAVGSVTERTLDNIQPALDDAVQRIFARFPVAPPAQD
jgi:hypothetical protein